VRLKGDGLPSLVALQGKFCIAAFNNIDTRRNSGVPSPVDLWEKFDALRKFAAAAERRAEFATHAL
jgi:hypothetical protein